MDILEMFFSGIWIIVRVLGPIVLMAYLMTLVLKAENLIKKKWRKTSSLKQDVQENEVQSSFDSIVIMLVRNAFFFIIFYVGSGMVGSTLGIFDEENAMIIFLIPLIVAIIFLLILSVTTILVKKWSHIKTIKNKNDASRGQRRKGVKAHEKRFRRKKS